MTVKVVLQDFLSIFAGLEVFTILAYALAAYIDYRRNFRRLDRDAREIFKHKWFTTLGVTTLWVLVLSVALTALLELVRFLR